MGGATRRKEEGASMEGFEPSRLGIVCDVSMAELTICPSSPRVDATVIAKGEGMEVAACDAEDAHMAKSVHAPWRRLATLLPMAQLSMLTITKGVQLAMRTQDTRMRAAGHAHGLDEAEQQIGPAQVDAERMVCELEHGDED